LNPNYDSYLQTATQLQRWRDFQAHVGAYLVINTVFVLIWARNGAASSGRCTRSSVGDSA
jgi:hypothetical protein